MTVCIGAICEDGKAAVVAADEMVTFGPPMNLQTEPPGLKKTIKLTDELVLLFSGTVPDGEEIVSRTRHHLGGMNKQQVAQVAEIVKDAYIQLKRKRAEEMILRPFIGADYVQFQTLIAQSAASQILQQLLAMMTQHNLQTDLLIAGADESGHHLFIVAHPGICLPMDTLGFAAIGSGGLHASVSLSLGGHTRADPLVQTLHNVYEAKKASEVAPGVGKLTDIAILKGGAISFVTKKLMAVLEKVHKDRPILSAEDQATISEAMA